MATSSDAAQPSDEAAAPRAAAARSGDVGDSAGPGVRPDDPRAGAVPFVGLTGGIGAGKSAALAALERLGAATLSTDAVVHELYGREDVVAAVVERWGEDVAPRGVVDRAAVARAAFGSAGDREWLEQLLWPRVGEEMWNWRVAQSARVPPPTALVVEVPLLFESGMDAAFDATIAVVADEGVRSDRAAARGQEAVAEREKRQLSQSEKADRATHVVDNTGTLEDLERALSAVLGTLSDP